MIELLERQKRLTVNQWKLICTANLADLLDFFDLFLIGYVTAALTKEWSLTYWQGGVISLATGVMVFTPGPNALIPGWLYLAIFRVFVGLGNAGIYAIDLPLVQEF